jgi:hypothetical protein
VRSAGGARGATGDARATRAARVYRGWLITTAVEQGSSRAPRCSSPPLFFSRPVRRTARAPLLRPARAPAGGARTTSGRADARPRGVPSAARPRRSRSASVLRISWW